MWQDVTVGIQLLLLPPNDKIRNRKSFLEFLHIEVSIFKDVSIVHKSFVTTLALFSKLLGS